MKATNPLTPVVIVKINGTELNIAQYALLSSVFVERTTSSCDRFELRFDTTLADAPKIAIGDAVEIAAEQSDASDVVLLNAEVTALSADVSHHAQSLVVSGFDGRHALTRTISIRSFNDQSFADVAKQIAGAHRLSLKDNTSGALSGTVFPHLMQAGSDFETLQQITYRIGAEWFVAGTELTIQLRPTSGEVVTLTPTEDLVHFNARFSPIERSGGVTVQGWDPAKTEPITGSAEEATSANDFPTASNGAKALAAAGVTAWAPVASRKEADDMAAAIERRHAESAVVGHGETTGTPQLVPGARCKIEDIGDDFSGTYHVTQVEHSFGAGGSYRTRFRIGPLEPSSFIDMFTDTDAAFGQVFNGITIGIVTNIEQEDKQPGAVKVQLPYLGTKIESTWARLMSFGGGKERGAAFVPEVGDEVLVAFEHGDITRPLVLGSVWNPKQNSALYDDTVQGGKVRERRITSKLGSRLRFIDEAARDDVSGVAIEVDDAKTRLFFGYNKTEIITQGRPFEIKNGKASILLDKDEITITASKITLKSNGNVDVSGTEVAVDGQSKVALSGAQAELKAQGQATLQSSGIMTIKGSMVKVN